VFHDITPGDNYFDASSTCGVPDSATGLFPVTTRYDLASGIGSPRFGSLAASLIVQLLPDPLPTGGRTGRPNPLPTRAPRGPGPVARTRCRGHDRSRERPRRVSLRFLVSYRDCQRSLTQERAKSHLRGSGATHRLSHTLLPSRALSTSAPGFSE
jgi:hypothetical protein